LSTGYAIDFRVIFNALLILIFYVLFITFCDFPLIIANMTDHIEGSVQVCEAKTSTTYAPQVLNLKPSLRNETVKIILSNEPNQIHDQTLRLSFPRLIAAYICLCACYFTSFLDMNSVTTALPTISHSLNAGATITWTGAAYLLGQTAFQPLYGRISDIIGRKPVLLASVMCIIVGGLLSGFAQSARWLYICRALNGIGGGGISSLVAIIVGDLVSLKERGKYQGLISMAIGTGATTGPFVAAGLIRARADGWRWVFWVPSIVASGCFVLLLFLLPLKPVEGKWKEKLSQVDWFGVGASVTGIVFLLVGSVLLQKHDLGIFKIINFELTTSADSRDLRRQHMVVG